MVSLYSNICSWKQLNELEKKFIQFYTETNKTHTCTGWFYNKTIVVTAAHCLVDTSYAYLIPETLEIHEDLEKHKKIKILPEQIEFHEDYIHYDDDCEISDNDIAKIKLVDPKEIDEAHMPKVVGKNHTLKSFESETLTLYGYGSKTFPDKLKKCYVHYINATTHEDKFHRDSTGAKKLMFTWPINGGKDYEHSLPGDSGAPVLNHHGEVVAIFIGGQNKLPDAFEPIAPHYDWIRREFNSNPNSKRQGFCSVQ